MEALTVVPLVMIALSSYLLWFVSLNRTLSGPRVWPLVGSLPGLVRNSSRMHEWIADNLRKTSFATYQTCICTVPFLARKQGLVTVTCNPKNLEHILKLRFDNYPKGPTWQAAFHDLLGEGIFNSDGETWLVQRKTAALEFTTRTLRHAMGRWVNRSIKNRLWRILESVESGRKAVDVQDLLLRLTFDNICGLAFGKDPETLSPELAENPFCSAFDRATESALQRFLFPEFIWRIKKMLGLGTEVTLKESVKIVESYMTEIIETRKRSIAENGIEAAQHDDLLSRFMKKKDGYGKAYPSDSLLYIALNFVLAGRDTSSVALSWFFYLVMNNPRVEEKIVAEISQVLSGTRGPNPAKWMEEPLTFDEVDRLVYLKAALSETLRLYPSVPQDFKYVLNDDVLPDGTMVPAGSSVTYSIYSVGRMEWIWGKDCMEFKPERWLSKAEDKYEPPQDPFKFISFNGGPRICLGKELAYLQMKSIAAAVLLRHRLSLVPGHQVVQKMSLTLFMKHGLKVYVSKRKFAC